MGTILAIDPGNIESGYVLVKHDGQEIRKVLDVGKVPNGEIFPVLCREYQHLASRTCTSQRWSSVACVERPSLSLMR